VKLRRLERLSDISGKRGTDANIGQTISKVARRASSDPGTAQFVPMLGEQIVDRLTHQNRLRKARLGGEFLQKLCFVWI
jgi:hypothetical protein